MYQRYGANGPKITCAEFRGKMCVWARDMAANVMYYAMEESGSFPVLADSLIRLITRVSVRFGKTFHEPKASEIYHISQLTSVKSALFL